MMEKYERDSHVLQLIDCEQQCTVGRKGAGHARNEASVEALDAVEVKD